MRFWILVTAILVLTFQSAQAADKPPPPPTLYTFQECTAKNPCPTKTEANSSPSRPNFALNGALTVKVNGTMPIKGWALLLDGSPSNIDAEGDKSRNALTFRLQRTSKNRDLWARLLGQPLSRNSVAVPVSLELNGAPLKFVSSDAEFSKPKPDVVSEGGGINLITPNVWLMALGMFLGLLVVAATIAMARNTSMIRDGIIPQLRPIDRSYSLGRTQMAFWFCLVFICFIFIAIVTYDINSINTQALTLMGIAAATALGAAAVDRSKNQDTTHFDDIKNRVTALGIVDASDVVKLGRAAALSTAATDPAAGVIPNAAIGNDLTPTVKRLWDTYWTLTEDARSEGFFKDLLNDINGPTIHRWQIVVWTLVLGGVYLISVYTNLAPPEFDNNLLALMGISGATYVGFKIPEKQTA